MPKQNGVTKKNGSYNHIYIYQLMDTSNVLASYSSFVYKESVVDGKKFQSEANQKAWVNGGMLDYFGALLIPHNQV